MATIRVPEQKVILCGEYGVGKSSIFRRFTNNTFVTATDRKSTLGLDYFDKIYHVCDKDVRVLAANRPLNSHPLNAISCVSIAATVGHGRHGTRRLHHIQLLQVCRGCHSRLLPRQSHIVSHPLAAPARHRHLRGEREDFPVRQQGGFGGGCPAPNHRQRNRSVLVRIISFS